jgi:Protein of unknown function (DUF3577)
MTPSSNHHSIESVDYFNAHTEGLGYLDSLVHVLPKPGQDFSAFWSASFCMLEGNPEKPEKTYVSLAVSSDKALEVLRPFVDDINGQTTKIFAGLRLARFRAKPFTFSADSQSPGKLGVNYSARLIAVLYLKVGESVITLKREEQVAPVEPELQLLPEVKLHKSDPDFQNKVVRLKAAGYRWDRDDFCWRLASNKPQQQQEYKQQYKQHGAYRQH